VRLDDAELVAFGVGQHDVLLLRELPDIQRLRTQPQRRCHRAPLVCGAGAGQVQVLAVSAHLLLAAGDEAEAELRVVAEKEPPTKVCDDLAAEHVGPERRQARWVARVERHCQESCRHDRIVGSGGPLGGLVGLS
jgi:hypothetical protein